MKLATILSMSLGLAAPGFCGPIATGKTAAPVGLTLPGLGAAPGASPVPTPVVGLGGVSPSLAPSLVPAGVPSLSPAAPVAPGIAAALAAPPPVGEAVPVAPGRGSRSVPAVSQVSYADAVSQRHRDLFQETLRRRRAPWSRGLAAMGVRLDGPVAPVLSVTEARDVSPGAAAVVRDTVFTVDWSQGETRVGSMRLGVRLKDLRLDFRRLPAPPAPEERQLRIRFARTVIRETPAGPVESPVTEADIAAFLEERGLRRLHRHWEGEQYAAVTGSVRAEDAARELSGKGPVLYAAPVSAKPPDAAQWWVAFKGKADARAVEPRVLGRALAEAGLSVLEAPREGAWRVAAIDGADAAAAVARLADSGLVLYASPVRSEPAEDRQAVVRFKGRWGKEPAPSDDDVAAFFRDHGVTVVSDYGGGAYKLQSRPGTTGTALAQRLAAAGIVESVHAVGSASAGTVDAAVREAIGHKGRPWSATEYGAARHMARWHLELSGATEEQLKLFDRLCDEAPVRGGSFNPWSGD